MANYASAFRTFASKAETTPGTAVTLADADANVRVWDLAISSLEVPMDMDPSKYATGDFGLGEGIPGPTSAGITFSTKFVNQNGEEPNWTKFAKAAGCSTSSGALGWTVYPDKYAAESTLTIGVYDLERGSSPSGLFYEFAGAIGNCTIATEGTGKPYMMNWEFTAGLNDIEDVVEEDIPVLTNVPSGIADRFLSGSGLFNGVNMCISTMELNFGNTVSPVQCVGASSGYDKFGITAMEPTLTVNPVLTRNSTFDFWNLFTTGTVMPIVIETEQFKLDIPRAQITSASTEDSDGILRTPLTFRILRPTASGSYNYAPFTILVKD